MMGKLQFAAILVLFFALLSSTGTTPQRTWTPGVAGGDYFTYEMYGVYVSQGSNPIAIPAFERNNTDWTRINVTSVSGSMVSQLYTLHLLNGSEVTFSFQTDVNPNNQGVFRIADKGVPLCAANLDPGERVPTAELKLDEAITRGTRLVNHASWNVSDDWGDIYFDRATGVLVEINRTHVFANPKTGDVVEKTDVVRLIDTNLW